MDYTTVKFSYIFFKVACLIGLAYNLTRSLWLGIILSGIYLVLYYYDTREQK
jgi:hypothetical protein